MKNIIKSLLTKKPPFISGYKYWLGAISLLIMAYAAGSIVFGNNGEVPGPEKGPRQVKTVKLETNGLQSEPIKALGAVKAKSRVDIVALAGGTARGVFFEVGDKVPAGKTLVALSDNITVTNLINAETNFANLQNSYLNAQRLAAETVRQAELGVKAAEGQVEAAEIALDTARDNLENYLALKDKTDDDAKKGAVTSFSGFLNTIFSALDQVDSVIKAEESAKPNGVQTDPALGAEDLSSLPRARASYLEANSAYLSLSDREAGQATIISDLRAAVNGLELSEKAVNDTIRVLDSTVSTPLYTETWISTQKSNFISLRNSIVSAESSAENILYNLENLDLRNDREQSGLENALRSAENRLDSAKTAYQNALAGLDSAKQSAQSQLQSAQTARDSSESQLRLARAQAADLSVSAPIEGTITAKTVELGSEVSPGMKLGEISQTGLLTIEAEVPAKDRGRVKIGGSAEFYSPNGERLAGSISKIYPAASDSSKKVLVEIAYVNSGGELIPGSFVDVSIPVEENRGGQKSLYIPLKALTIAANEKYVFTVENGQAVKKTVEADQTQGSQIEILSGLADTDELIVEGAKSVEDGEAVEVID